MNYCSAPQLDLIIQGVQKRWVENSWSDW